MDVKNEGLLPLFVVVKQLLTPYAEQLTIHRDEPGYFDLWSEKDIVDGRRRKEVSFCSLIIQKSYVGFSFMLVCADGDLSQVFGRDLMATLKGRSCFHFKRGTPEVKAQIEDALAAGWRLYEEHGRV